MQLYIHVPFCKSKCRYCDFNSYPCVNDATILRYLNALNTEIALAGQCYRNAKIDTVYIGGGTPSALDAKYMASICKNLAKHFDLSCVKEWSIECNPESIDEEKLRLYKEVGIDRISIGVQSLSDDNLKAVGRIHDARLALEKLRLAKRYFDNVSCDLIIGLPYDDENSVGEEVATLAPLVEHISMYELIIEDGTPLKSMVEKEEIRLPCDDETQTLFEIAMQTAQNFGFERYEVSNFAKYGLISRHNYGYWMREEYLGLGAGAHSLVKTKDGVLPLEKQERFANVKGVDEYIDNVESASEYSAVKRTDREYLSAKDVKNEQIMLGLRTTRGVESSLLDVPQHLKNFFEFDGLYTRLTQNGMAVMNPILAEILDI